MDEPQAERLGVPLLLAGAGKMGGALLRAWLTKGYDPSKITVVEPQPSRQLLELSESRRVALGPPPESPRVLVLAMKPQSLDAAAEGLASFTGPDTLIVSILAGKTIGNIATRFPKARAIVRAMPNLAAAIGRGMTVLAANAAVSPAQRKVAEALLRAAGQTLWLDNENLIDAATAISGSGPAYVFYLVEALARAGEAVGLPAALSGQLARATIEGAGELLHQNPATSAAELRQNVTSPGGTTAAGLAVLMAQDGLTPLLERAVKAAKERAAELSG